MADKSGIGKQQKSGRGPGMKMKTTRMPSAFLEKVGRGRGSIKAQRYDVSQWTTKNYVFALSILIIPYCALLFAIYSAGMTFLVYILLGVTVLSGLLVALAYWVDKADL